MDRPVPLTRTACSVNPLGNNATLLADFVRVSDEAGIDIQFCAGQALDAAEIVQYTRRCE